MFVLAISSPISNTVGIHQHSNNVTWHRKAICNYFRAGERENRRKKKNKTSLGCFFWLSLCCQAEHLEFLFLGEIQKQTDCKGFRVSPGLWKSHLTLSLSRFPTTIPHCLLRSNCTQSILLLASPHMFPPISENIAPRIACKLKNMPFFFWKREQINLPACQRSSFKTLRRRALTASL